MKMRGMSLDMFGVMYIGIGYFGRTRLYLPFGRKNSPRCFQRMDEIPDAGIANRQVRSSALGFDDGTEGYFEDSIYRRKEGNDT